MLFIPQVIPTWTDITWNLKDDGVNSNPISTSYESDLFLFLDSMKQCQLCWKEFPTKWPKKYCLECSKIINKQQQAKRRAEHKH